MILKFLVSCLSITQILGYYIIADDPESTEEVSAKGCAYDDLPKHQYGTWECRTLIGKNSRIRSVCDLKCNEGFGLKINHLKKNQNKSIRNIDDNLIDKWRLKARRIVCQKNQWKPTMGGEIWPQCHNQCGELKLTQDQNNPNDRKAKLVCRNIMGLHDNQSEPECIPGVSCVNLATCYATCEAGFHKENTPAHDNEIKCLCTQYKCGWEIPKDLGKLGNCEFKMKSSNRRIIGGYDADNLRVQRSQISLGTVQMTTENGRRRYNWSHFCGGVLLTANWGFTAAHCRTAGMRALLGEYDFEQRSGQEVPCRVRSQIRHTGYNGGTVDDIMLIYMTCRNLVMNENIWPAMLPPANTEPPWQSECEVCGWGTITYPKYQIATRLQCIQLPIMKNDECNEGYAGAIHDDVMCLGNGQDGMDSCQGDSGGGAFCNGISYGIVMGGLYCANSTYPGVYTQVSHYIPWAIRVIRAYMARTRSCRQGVGCSGRKRRHLEDSYYLLK